MPVEGLVDGGYEPVRDLDDWAQESSDAVQSPLAETGVTLDDLRQATLTATEEMLFPAIADGRIDPYGDELVTVMGSVSWGALEVSEVASSGVSSLEGATDEQLLQLHEMAVLVTRQSATLSAMGGGYQIPAVEMLDLLIAVEVEMVERDITEPLQLLCAV